MTIQNVFFYFKHSAYHSKLNFMPQIMKHEIIFKNRKLKCEWKTYRGEKKEFKIYLKFPEESLNIQVLFIISYV